MIELIETVNEKSQEIRSMFYRMGKTELLNNFIYDLEPKERDAKIFTFKGVRFRCGWITSNKLEKAIWKQNGAFMATNLNQVDTANETTLSFDEKEKIQICKMQFLKVYDQWKKHLDPVDLVCIDDIKIMAKLVRDGKSAQCAFMREMINEYRRIRKFSICQITDHEVLNNLIDTSD